MRDRKIGLMLIATLSLAACGSAGSGSVAVLVEMTPQIGQQQNWQADGELVGAQRTYLTQGGDRLGGVFLFADMAGANAAINAQWRANIAKRYGGILRIEKFSVPAMTAGGAKTRPNASAIVAIVRVPPPWYAFDFIVRRRMAERVSEYAALPDLHYKYFTIDSENRVGGVYLWRDQEAANAFYDREWVAAVEDKYGHPASVELLRATSVIAR